MQISKGQLHPMSLLADDAIRVFSELGFEMATGPELEHEWYNFDALNVSKDHPARDMQDTFWIKQTPEEIAKAQNGERSSRPVLRTHTTSVSMRMIEKAAKGGIKEAGYIAIGKTFRNEATDITHEAQFHQIDGVMIGENITLANMKAVLIKFYQTMLGSETEIQFRPSFFPFTEPSVEVHAKFNGKWLEMMGGGMLHPNVLRNAGLDPEKVQGFAFGGGLDRILMIKHNIPDVRFLYQGDLRINQF